MKMAVFWDVAPCRLVEIDNDSVVLTASIIRAIETSQLQLFDTGHRENPRTELL
jgi:hypothetical protein